MNYERREAFKQIAERVATRLLTALKANQLPKIDIYSIRAALRLETGCPRDATGFDALEEMTTRRVVEKCG